MNSLLKKDVAFRWDEKGLRYFEYIKKSISQAPVLVSLDYSRDFMIFSFSSQDTIAGVLLKKDVDDHEHPIAFTSKVLRDS